MTRPDGRRPEELREVAIRLGVQRDPAGSVEISLGGTTVLCAATVAEKVPGWLAGSGRGWVTAEYAMLPGAVPERAGRGPSSRGREIQRLIGRSLRAAVDLEALGPCTITVDCDVLQADGGTRVAAITGGFLALALALDARRRAGVLRRSPLVLEVVGVAAAVVNGVVVLDPAYAEDSVADVDANFAVARDGRLLEIQCTAERAPLSDEQLQQLLALARQGAATLMTHLDPLLPDLG